MPFWRTLTVAVDPPGRNVPHPGLETGAAPLFKWISPEPIASASLGQVIAWSTRFFSSALMDQNAPAM